MYISTENVEDFNTEARENWRNLNDEAKLLILSYFKYVITLFFTFLMLQIDQFSHFGIVVGIIPLQTLESGLLLYYWSYMVFVCEKVIVFDILCSFFDLMLWTILMFCLNTYQLSLFYTLIPLGSNIIIKSLYAFKYSTSTFKIFEKYLILIRIFAFFIMLFISLKKENFIEISWQAALWPLWILIYLIIALSICCFFKLIISFVTVIDGSVLNKIIYLYSTITSLGFSIASCVTVYFVINQESLFTFVPIICYLLVIILLTLVFFDRIAEFIVSISNLRNIDQYTDIQSNNLPNSSENQINHSSYLMNSRLKFFEKISQTFFKPLRKRTLSHIYEENEASIHQVNKSCEIRLYENSEQDLSPVDKKCLICLLAPCNAVIIECGHGGICQRCAIELKTNQKTCHLCRGSILKIALIGSRIENLVKIEELI